MDVHQAPNKPIKCDALHPAFLVQRFVCFDSSEGRALLQSLGMLKSNFVFIGYFFAQERCHKSHSFIARLSIKYVETQVVSFVLPLAPAMHHRIIHRYTVTKGLPVYLPICPVMQP
ncbi:hypothetical protein [Photobacterium marinum]|uniref:hypothetical protein n=1 Tax=Photobacterium marinum TaxID=1056511 RepID=UPI0012FC96C9|nr:hypothetical protein [Photobacterium marinum]